MIQRSRLFSARFAKNRAFLGACQAFECDSRSVESCLPVRLDGRFSPPNGTGPPFYQGALNGNAIRGTCLSCGALEMDARANCDFLLLAFELKSAPPCFSPAD